MDKHLNGRVPFGIVVALLIAALVFAAEARAKPNAALGFWCELSYPSGGTDGRQLTEQNRGDVSASSSGSGVLAEETELLSVTEDTVVIQVRIKHYTGAGDLDEAREQLRDVPYQKFTWKPGDQFDVSIEGGGTATLSGRILRLDQE